MPPAPNWTSVEPHERHHTRTSQTVLSERQCLPDAGGEVDVRPEDGVPHTDVDRPSDTGACNTLPAALERKTFAWTYRR
jgi:hypothetical protein